MDLYHVTPQKNRDSIQHSGVEPLYSTGKMRVSWWVDRSRLVWAIAHVSARHHVAVDKLDVWVASEAQVKNKRRTPWKGVFNTGCRTIPSHWHSAAREVATPDGPDAITKRL